ncbi:MAG: ABC transporter permease [Nitrososphaerales archaeon]
MFKEEIKIFLKGGSGKVGLALFTLLLALSLYVIASFPLDFGVRYWNNPSYWADYPITVPPAWYNFFSDNPKPEHKIISAEEKSFDNNLQLSFRFKQVYDDFPSFISLRLGKFTLNSLNPLTLELYLKRPDSEFILLKRQILTSSFEGNPPFNLYFDEPLRISLTADPDVSFEISSFLSRKYNFKILQTELLSKGAHVALFGKPEKDILIPLKGDYEIVVNLKLSDPKDKVGEARLILGGGVYGLMGTDSLGRDLFVGLLFGFPVALFIGAVVSFLVALIGTFNGIISGYMGGKSDTLIQRASDILANMPLLPLLIFLTFVLGQKLWLVMLILIVFGWPGLTILIRSMVLQIKSFQFIEAAQALGSTRGRIILKHIFPQTAPFVFAQMIFSVPGAILAEAALSFLGLGDPSLPTWGQILELGFRRGGIYSGYWWWILPPGILIMITAFTFLLIALALEPLVNPRLRRIK